MYKREEHVKTLLLHKGIFRKPFIIDANIMNILEKNPTNVRVSDRRNAVISE